MDGMITDLLTSIDAEISRLQQVRNLLAGTNVGPRRAAATITPKPKRILSADARARISAAQKRRWAAQKKATK
jgi:hypothetical protein